MSVDGGKVVLRFEVDLSQLQTAMTQAGNAAEALKAKVEGGSGGLTTFTGAATKAGQEATTAAVKFQTLAQGAINLTTSFTQAYTSISNLTRAKTSLQASALGVERAQDSLARTQYQLNKAMNAAKPDLERIQLLQNRLKTNSDALSVAQMRLRDETDRVRDTYVLFGLNLVNVGFSAIQTIKIMKDMTVGIKAVTAATAILNALTSKYVIVALALIAAYEGTITVLQAAGVEWAKGKHIIELASGAMNDFNHAQDITLKNYSDSLDEANDSLSRWGKAEEQALSHSNLRFREWAQERYRIRAADMEQQVELNYLTGGVVRRDFQSAR